MDLDRKIEIITLCRSVSLGWFEHDQQYPIVHAERIKTRYVEIVLLVILDKPTTSVKVFISRRYGDVVSDEYLQSHQYETCDPIYDL